MKGAEIREIIRSHYDWNWGLGGERANFRKADLQGAIFGKVDLQMADFREADLRRTNLQRANLPHADFRWANLEKADLRGANLTKSDLRWANLERADIRWSDLNGSDLEKANLQRVNLERSDLQGTNLKGANLLFANLQGVNLWDAKHAPIFMHVGPWDVYIHDGEMQIGCECRSFAAWRNLSDEEISKIDDRALEFWQKNKVFLLAACAVIEGETR